MAEGPIQAANLIESVLTVTSPPRQTRDVLYDIIVQQKWASNEDAYEKSEAWLERFKSRLRLIISKYNNEGRFRLFSFNSSGDDYLQGSCFAEPHDDEDIKDAKRRRAHTINIYHSISKISPNDFEILSKNILRLLGVELAYITRRSADHGIDFFGRVPFGKIIQPSLLDPGAEKNFYIWIVGQSKHYPDSRVSTPEIRDLIGAIHLARAKVFSGKNNPLEHLIIKICDPVFYLFFTSGTFTKDSIDILTNSGVLSFDGYQIAQFLADKNIGIIDGVFDEANFVSWSRKD